MQRRIQTGEISYGYGRMGTVAIVFIDGIKIGEAQKESPESKYTYWTFIYKGQNLKGHSMEDVKNDLWEILHEENIEDLVSNCCGMKRVSNGDVDSAEMGVCPECLEPCEYIKMPE